MITYFRLLLLFFRLGLLSEMEYRANFYVQVFQSLLGLGMSLGGLAVVFSHTDTLGGWRPDELLALLGVFFLIGGLIHLVVQPSMSRFMEDVRMGTLDFTLTKPEDAQLLVSIKQFEVWKFADVILGLVVLGIALARLRLSLGLGQAAAFGLVLLCGAAIVYSFWLFLATLSFWFVRVENILVIFESVYEAGRWPVSIYPRWLRLTLTFVVPVAFAVTVPAQSLIGRLNTQTLLGAIALALFLLLLSRLFWKIGIRHYSGASA
ncbi:MAG: ABC-2 family transporter protein [Chloroflexi bacterium]|nr:ABC-2 family transporter protein [Chloroflexota bacterium]MCI0576189.1 ABC-2 family transporter protein [Chloroflexota bacterium]MCI0645517.1 ABC-2 family transporter protein [Chloroflexota bacterium]MCI0730656.1 ABC-2 family transporter protein [Chloroflexota bacterium]